MRKTDAVLDIQQNVIFLETFMDAFPVANYIIKLTNFLCLFFFFFAFHQELFMENIVNKEHPLPISPGRHR